MLVSTDEPHACPVAEPVGWQALLPPHRTAVMGVINATPDSFSDGGDWHLPQTAATRARVLVAAGADLLDVGGESTRPGAPPVPADVERDRVVPVIAAIRDAGVSVPITIDTRRAAVATAALDAGADAVNDVSALADDPHMAPLLAARQVPVVLMHKVGDPATMQADPRYDNVVASVCRHLVDRVGRAVAAGIPRSHLAVDPGIGFGKSVRHNLLLLRDLPRLVELGLPVVVGTSRKSFIGTLLDAPVDQRQWGTAATVAWVVALGGRVVRVHDVGEMSQVVRMVDAIRRGRAS